MIAIHKRASLLMLRNNNPFMLCCSRPFSNLEHSSTKRKPTPEQQMQAIFASDSTFQLVKKLFIYRMMSSNFFINNALCGMRLAYKFMGRSLTNLLINSTAGSIFTSGETLQTLVRDIEVLEKKGIHGVANYVVEGLHEMHEPTI